MRLHTNVIKAVFWRNFISYFSNPIGYLFITAFVLFCGYFAFWHNDAFFATNIADLDQLNGYFPYLLLFFIPAITMTVWAEERKTGTEELLLTLPATDLEVVLGKYLAALAIYTIALAFSVSNVIVLQVLGRPDLGLMFATYLGYWLLGAALLAAGMVASMLTSNVTVSFILGAAICVLLVSFGQFSLLLPPESAARELVERAGVIRQFDPFGKGLISGSGVFYFLSIIAVMLYLNVVLLGRRHWGGSRQAPGKWFHYATRAACLAVIAVSVTLLANRGQRYLQADATQEKIFSLSPRTREVISEIDPNRPVLIEAFISKSVPRELAETKKNLEDLLLQYDAMGGSKIEVKINQTDLYSKEAADAERVYDIRPETVPTQVDGRFGREEVFLGVAFKSGATTKTIPFFYRGLPIEYELTRMIRTVAEKQKRKVGVLATDAGMFGSFNFQSMAPSRDWLIIDELKQQYDVEQVSPDTEIVAAVDVLIVPMASSLSQPQIDNLTAWVKKGKPTLIFDDPMPVINPRLAAKEQKQRNNNPMFGGAPPPVPKGNLTALMDVLNIRFDAGNVIWQRWNPHPQFKDLPLEYVFIGNGNGNPQAFNTQSVVTNGLQEIITIYPGSLSPKGGPGPGFTPLLQTGGTSGMTPWNDTFIDAVFGMRALNPYPRRRAGVGEYTLAALVQGKLAGGVDAAPEKKPDEAKAADKKDEKTETKTEAKAEAPEIKAIVIADLDMISDAFFELRRQGEENLLFDNVTFVANCVDLLAGDESFVELRKKRLRRRNLALIDRLTENATKEYQRVDEQADQQAQDELAKAQADLDNKVNEISKRTDLDERSKRVQIEYLRQVEQQKFDVKKDEIERQKKQVKRQANDKLQTEKRSVQSWIKVLAVVIPPIPAFLLGLAVFFARISGEREGVNPDRVVGERK